MRRFGDRYDGYKLRKVDPLFRVIPHIMPNRDDAQVFFEEKINFEITKSFIQQLRKEGHKVGYLHVVIAAIVRTISQKPKINRFVRGKKTYARKEISVSLAIKKDMSMDGEETTVKLKFKPTDTIFDVIDIVNEAVLLNKEEDSSNNTDKAAKLFNLLPNFLLSMVIGFLKFLDNRGHMPKSIIELSPFHSSIFVTDLGSLGIKPIYHHIYNFGTNSMFLAFGTRDKEQIIEEDLSLSKQQSMVIKIVADERIVDGFYFANALKYAKKILANPEGLLTPPDKVYKDNQI